MASEATVLLHDLVAIPSPSRHEGAAVDHLVRWLAERGAAAHVDAAGNAVGSKGDGPREILLLGHIDTFPGELAVRVEGGVLHGRGTVDAKGPLCAFAAALAGTTPPPGWRLTVVGAVEEEAATSKGARQVAADRGGGPPAFCLIGEPSRWDRITLGYKGRLLLDATLRAPFAHSAGQEALPAERGVALWQQVVDLCRAWDERRGAASPFTTLTPALRSIVTRDEGAWGTVELGIGFRLPPGLDPGPVQEQLESALSPPPGGELALAFSGAEVPHRSGREGALVRSMLGAIRGAGGKPRFVVKTGTCDMNVVAPAWPDTPILAYGPGDSSLDHTPQEHIELTEYERAITVLKAALGTLMERGS